MHALLSVLLVATASWHAIELGRHTDVALSLLVVALASAAVLVVIRKTVSDAHKPVSQTEGARP